MVDCLNYRAQPQPSQVSQMVYTVTAQVWQAMMQYYTQYRVLLQGGCGLVLSDMHENY